MINNADLLTFHFKEEKLDVDVCVQSSILRKPQPHSLPSFAMKTGIIIKDLKSRRMTILQTNSEDTGQSKHSVFTGNSMEAERSLMKRSELTFQNPNTPTAATKTSLGIVTNFSTEVSSTVGILQTDKKGNSGEKTAKLLSKENNESLESMKGKIAMYVSYLDSETDSSDAEQGNADQASCQNKTIQNTCQNKNDKESSDENRLFSSKKDIEKNKEKRRIEEMEFFERKFQSFTTRWDVKSRRFSKAEMTRRKNTPAIDQCTFNCDVEQTKSCLNGSPTVHEAKTETNTIFKENTVCTDDSVIVCDNHLKQTSYLQLNTDTESHSTRLNESEIFRGDKYYPVTANNTSFYDEVFHLKEISPEEIELSENDDDHDKGNDVNEAPGVGKFREEKILQESKNKDYEQKRKYTVQNQENTDLKTAQLGEISLLGNVELSQNTPDNIHGTTHDNQNEDTRELLMSSNRIKPVIENYANKTIKQSNPGNENDECTSTEKNNLKSLSQTSKITGRKLFVPESESLSCKQRDGRLKEIPIDDKDGERSKSVQIEDKKDRKRSRSISLERERKRSRRSVSSERSRKDSPKRDRRTPGKYQRYSQERKGMQHDRPGRNRRDGSNDHLFRRWFDNIVVKLADPQRPPRKKQKKAINRNDSRQTRRGKFETRTGKRFHIVERALPTKNNRNDRDQGIRRWSYDDYVRTKSGRLRRKTAADYEDNANPHWKR